jgi:hypothetical protein
MQSASALLKRGVVLYRLLHAKLFGLVFGLLNSFTGVPKKACQDVEIASRKVRTSLIGSIVVRGEQQICIVWIASLRLQVML